jgi:hypothetical protein
MQKAIKRTPVYKQEISHYEEKVVYVTDDRRVYDTEREALEHENYIIYNKIKRIDVDIRYESLRLSIAFRPANEEELKALKIRFNVGRAYNNPSINDQINPKGDLLNLGEWIFCYYVNNEDTEDDVYLYTYSYLKQQMESFIEEFKE